MVLQDQEHGLSKNQREEGYDWKGFSSSQRMESHFMDGFPSRVIFVFSPRELFSIPIHQISWCGDISFLAMCLSFLSYYVSSPYQNGVEMTDISHGERKTETTKMETKLANHEIRSTNGLEMGSQGIVHGELHGKSMMPFAEKEFFLVIN